jgi:hypothetical protein
MRVMVSFALYCNIKTHVVDNNKEVEHRIQNKVITKWGKTIYLKSL